MHDRVAAFMDAWLKKNLTFAGEGREDSAANMEADALAESCIVDAEAQGITAEELEGECGDLVALIQARLDAEVGA